MFRRRVWAAVVVGLFDGLYAFCVGFARGFAREMGFEGRGSRAYEPVGDDMA